MMDFTENLCGLLFELSSKERMNVLVRIQEQKLKLSKLSKELDMTVTETSRHLERLIKAKLIQKDVDGSYCLTLFGELTLSLLSGLDFISRNMDYFLEHDIFCIPCEFISRIGELRESNLGVDTFKNIHSVGVMFQEAQEYIWILTDQILTSAGSIVEEKMKRGIELRSILPEDLVPPPGYKLPPLTSGIQRRVLPTVKIVIVMTEKVAAVCLPNLRGKMDYTGFGGEDPKFHKWVKDLYLYYWEQAKPATIFPRKND